MTGFVLLSFPGFFRCYQGLLCLDMNLVVPVYISFIAREGQPGKGLARSLRNRFRFIAFERERM